MTMEKLVEILISPMPPTLFENKTKLENGKEAKERTKKKGEKEGEKEAGKEGEKEKKERIFGRVEGNSYVYHNIID